MLTAVTKVEKKNREEAIYYEEITKPFNKLKICVCVCVLHLASFLLTPSPLPSPPYEEREGKGRNIINSKFSSIVNKYVRSTIMTAIIIVLYFYYYLSRHPSAISAEKNNRQPVWRH